MKKYSKFLAVVLAFAMVLPGVAQAAKVETTEGGIEVTRLGGVDRVGTAVLASETAYKDGAESVVLAGFNGEVDALTGTLLAADKNAPLLVTRQAKLTDETKAEIKRLKAKTVYILGGEDAVSAAVETELEGLVDSVVRVKGSGREDTAANVAKEVKGTNASDVFLALGRPATEGDALADALAIGPVSAMKKAPVLLAKKDSIPSETVQAMKDLNVKNVTIVGGTSAIAPSVEEALKAEGYTVTRIGESGREKTALKIAETYFADPANLIVAYGRKSADALVGGYMGAKLNAPILLTNNAGLTEETVAYVTANPLSTFVLGGENVITDTVLQQVVTALEAGEVVELKVESVSAIKQTIAKNKDVDLKFEVNGKEYTKETFDEKFGEEDYTVKFLYNFTANDDNRAGKVNTTEDFKYAVQVYLEGKEVNEVEAKDFVDVKVVKADKAVSIEKVILDNENVDYLMVKEEGAGFKVTEAKNALGEDLDEDSLEALQPTKVVSSDVTVAYVDNANNIEVRKTGKVTFTLTYYTGDDAITVKLPVEVKEAGVATKVEAENQKVAAGTAFKDLDFKVFDQHGLDITNSDVYTHKFTDVDGDKVDDLSNKGIYTVEIFAKKDTKQEKALGSFTVTVVDVESVEYDEFFFEDIKDTEGKEIVLNVEKEEGKHKVGSKNLNLKGKKDGVTVLAKDVTKAADKADGYHFDFDDEVFSDVTIEEGVVTVELDSDLDKATTSTVRLTHKQGDLVQELAEVELEIIKTTPQIDNLALAKDVKVLDVVETDEANEVSDWEVYDIKQLTSTDVKDKDGNVIALDEDMIAKVEFSANDGKAIVTIADIYGGKEFVFDAADQATVKTDAELNKALGNERVKTIVLGDDIKLEGPNYTITKENVVIDGNGYAIESPQLRVNGNGITIKNLEQGETALRIVVTATDVKIIDNQLNGGDTGVAVYFNKTSSGEVKGNTIVTKHKGIGADTTGKMTITGNTITATNTAIELFDGNGENIVEINETPETVGNLTNYTVSGNTIK